ncbi:MAG: hypothetical protein AAGI91_14375 [Bacteroidota bacterium]
MTTEQEHIQAILEAWPERVGAPPGLLEAVNAALREYPQSPQLWCIRGDLIQLSDDGDDGLDLENALRSYERALELEPAWVEAYEEIGYFWDLVMNEPDRAEPYFERATKLRGEAS